MTDFCLVLIFEKPSTSQRRETAEYQERGLVMSWLY